MKTKLVEIEIPEDSEIFFCVSRSSKTHFINLYPSQMSIHSGDVTSSLWNATKCFADFFAERNISEAGKVSPEQGVSVIAEEYIKYYKSDMDYNADRIYNSSKDI